ncbi:MazG nucleotide pyrophosphohydrolase domain-containing protein [Paenibacillus sp. HJGM_3]|uniref:MazG nucleotide pyrophosphohydrolase domain-containing protein n=1 Tax=Paenibacillus sp. HJGM_3 TaxID=3379816 RepID=UPI00385FB0DF
MNKPITLNGLQSHIKQTDYRPEHRMRYYLKLVEEVGELAEVIRKDARLEKNEGRIKGTIEEELCDVLYYVAALANVYDIDLEACFEQKDAINKVKWNKW